MIQDPMALQILDGKILPGEHVVAEKDGKNDAMHFERAPSTAAAAGSVK